MFGQSIRSRIQIWHTLLLSLIMCGLLMSFFYHEKQIKEREFDAALLSPITAMIPYFIELPGPGRQGPGRQGPDGPGVDRPGPSRPGGSGFGPGSGTARGGAGRPDASRPRVPASETSRMTSEERIERRDELIEEIMEEGRYVLAVRPDGTVDISSPNAPKEVTPIDVPTPINNPISILRTIGDNRECAHLGPGGHALIFGASLAGIHQEMALLRWQLVGVGFAVVFLGHWISWLLVGQSLRSIRSVTDAAEQISNGDLSQRIDEDDTKSELGQMVGVLNRTFGKMESSFDQQVRFTADASHELRTPVSVILAKCQFALMRERSPEKYRDALKTCETSAQHVRNLVESLLELARVDSGEFKVIKSPGDLAQVAESAVNLLQTLAEEKDIELRTDLQLAQAEFDYERVHQVAMNLISNAIKYTQAGGSVSVTTRSELGRAVIQIRDTGAGIRGEDIPHVFDRFFRTSRERSDERKSTGLGLAITKAIVDAHDATIDVISEFEKGATFIVSFPVGDQSPNRVDAPK